MIRSGRWMLAAAVIVAILLVGAACSGGTDSNAAKAGTEDGSDATTSTTATAELDCPSKPGAGTVTDARTTPYEPTLASLDEHGAPEWWRDAKFGIFIHWGAYSVPAYAISC